MTRAEADVVIIGGGLAGLACALALRDSDLRIVLCEADRRLGGRAQSWPDPHTGDRIDIGPHIFLSEYRNLLDLLEQLGTHARLVWQTDKLITLIDRGAIPMQMYRLPAPLHLAPNLPRALRRISLRDALSNVRVGWHAMGLDERTLLEYDDRSAYDYLRTQGVSPRSMEWFWASACMTLMNVPLQACSAAALLRFFRQLIGHSGYRFGFAGCALDELFVPPALRRLHDAGADIRVHTPIDTIDVAEDRVSGVRLRDGTHIAARYCVSAVAPQSLATLVPRPWRTAAPFCDAVQFQPSAYVSSYLWFDRKLTRERFWTRLWALDNLTYDSYDLSNIRPGWDARGSVIVSNIIYANTRVDGLSDDELIAATLAELAVHLPVVRKARLHHCSVHRIPMAIPQPLVGSEKRRPFTVTPIRHLYLAGDWTRTGLPACMESAVRAGRLAAEAIHEAMGQPRRFALPIPETTGLAGWVRRASTAWQRNGT